MIPVPVLSPRLSSLWLRLITPLYASVGRKLVDSLRNSTVVHDDEARRVFTIHPVSMRVAIDRALRNEDRAFAETRWSDAFSSLGSAQPRKGSHFGSRLIDSRTCVVRADVAHAFRPIRRIGGDTGWYFANWIWVLRGGIDIMLGGPGLRRGRRNPEALRVGDPLDFWRVEAYEPDRLLRLSAEMRLPGRAWLQFEVEPEASGCRVRQTAEFDPLGLSGRLYWYTLYPVHQMVFAGMLHRIAALAEKEKGE